MCGPVEKATAASETKYEEIPSGVARRKFLIESGLLSFSVLYGVVYHVNPDIPVLAQYCEGEDECLRPDLLAYKATALVAMSTMGLMGVYNWHFNPRIRQLSKATPEDRLFGLNLDSADYTNVVILCYQFYDLCLSLTIPDNRDPIFLIHHVLAMITSYCALEYQMVPYYSIFYGGCSEFSSIFFVFISKDMVAVTPGSLFDQWLLVCKVMFFFSFTYYRVFGWIYNSFLLWRDCRIVIESGACERHRPGKAFFLRLFQGLDLVLGALQCFWYYQIIMMIAAM